MLNELANIIDILFSPVGLIFCLLAVVFRWRSYNKKRGIREGVGETNLSQEDQLVNFYGTNEMQGNKVLYIEETEKGFKAGVQEKDGEITGYFVERD